MARKRNIVSNDNPAAGPAPPQTEHLLPYFPGIDGLRAIAVVVVLLYHAGSQVLGGFLGVETFFVLSGFLITALLLNEWRQARTIKLGSFWLRRARRLLPALGLTLLGSIVFTMVLRPGQLGDLGGHLLAALGYVMNWHLIASQQSYFDPLARPPLLQHLWSLAIEEQFYLLWPLLFWLGFRFLGRRTFLPMVTIGAGASFLLMASLYDPGVDPSRLYYGTDTRASALLLGCALALVWSPWRSAGAASAGVGRVVDLGGLAAFTGLLIAYVHLYEQHPLLYRGGFALVAVATALVIAALTHPHAVLLPRLLSLPPLLWIGQRSYGIYLWHWPIFMITRPSVDIPVSGLPLFLLRITLVIGIAALSHHYVEQPIQHVGFLAAWRRLRSWTEQPLRRLMPVKAVLRPLHSRPLWSVTVMSLLMGVACAAPAGPDGISSQASSADVRETTVSPSASTGSTPTVDIPAQTTSPSPVAPTTAGTTAASPSAVAPTSGSTTAPETMAETETASAAAQTDETTTARLASFDAELAQELQRILDETVADGVIPGVVLSVSIPGQAPWTGSSGIADREQRRPMEPETPVRIASISKTFTAVVVLQLVEEGRIDLDAPLSTYLPDLPLKGNRITVRNLLNHTSGLYDYLEDRNYFTQAYRNTERTYTPRELVEYAAQFAPAFQAGSAGNWDYSSTNYVILGMLVEEVTGNSLAQEMRQRIFAPLDLDLTFFPPEEQPPANTARGYSEDEDRSGVSLSFAFATANIVSTADDVRRFADALAAGELLGPASLEQMYTFVSGKGQYKMPDLEYGLGVMRHRLPVGPRGDGQQRRASSSTVIGHIGGFGGFRSAAWTAPEGGITVALAVNQAAVVNPNTLSTQVFDAILTHQGR